MSKLKEREFIICVAALILSGLAVVTGHATWEQVESLVKWVVVGYAGSRGLAKIGGKP